MNPFDVYMQYAATGDGAVLAGVPEEDREFVTGIWPPEFERILNGESANCGAALSWRGCVP